MVFGMLGQIIKNFFTGYATRLYPFEKREEFENVRGELHINIEKCTFCMVCQKRCPSDAIEIDRKEAIWTLNPSRCILCNICVEDCKFDALYMTSKWRAPFIKNEPVSFKGSLPAKKNKEEDA